MVPLMGLSTISGLVGMPTIGDGDPAWPPVQGASQGFAGS